MDQAATGRYIHRKRKERNLTQAQLAERLGVSNKTVSKWENGKCMPDYAVMEDLCDELGTTPGELLDAADAGADGAQGHPRDEARQRAVLVGIALVALGAALLAASRALGGSDAHDLFAGVLLGVSVGIALLGAFCVGIGVRRTR